MSGSLSRIHLINSPMRQTSCQPTPSNMSSFFAQLSGYFVQRGDYETAVHCLTAAGVVLERAGITVHTENGGDVVANVLIGYGKL